MLNDLDKYLQAQAWSRTGLVHGTDQEKQVVTGQLRQLDALVVDVASYLRTPIPAGRQRRAARHRALARSVRIRPPEPDP